MIRILILAEHPLDLATGVGAAASRWVRDGSEVAVIYPGTTGDADPWEVRAAEAVAAALGIRAIFPDTAPLGEEGPLTRVEEVVRETIDSFRPAWLLAPATPAGDAPAGAVAGVLGAVLGWMTGEVRVPPSLVRVVRYPARGSDLPMAEGGGFRPTMWVGVGDEDIDRAVRACATWCDESGPPPDREAHRSAWTARAAADLIRRRTEWGGVLAGFPPGGRAVPLQTIWERVPESGE